MSGTSQMTVSVLQAYGRELSEAYEWCNKYRHSRKEAELHQAWDLYYHVFKRINKQLPSLTVLEVQYVAPALVRAQVSPCFYYFLLLLLFFLFFFCCCFFFFFSYVMLDQPGGAVVRARVSPCPYFVFSLCASFSSSSLLASLSSSSFSACLTILEMQCVDIALVRAQVSPVVNFNDFRQFTSGSNANGS